MSNRLTRGVAAFRRLTAAVAFAALSAAAPALADPLSESRSVVERQLDAFAAGDFVAAYGFAGAGIRSKFPTPEIFEQMVRGGYPMVVAPRVADFVGAEEQGGVVLQRLRLVDQNGVAYVARYYLSQTDEGWRIIGVEIERAPDANV